MARAEERLLVLYDVECAFCAWGIAWLLRWDRARRLQPAAIQSEQGARVLAAMPAEQRLSSWHVADQCGVRSAGAALAVVLGVLPGGRPLAALARSYPRAVEAAYRWVADHRARLSRLLPRASKRCACALISARMH